MGNKIIDKLFLFTELLLSDAQVVVYADYSVLECLELSIDLVVDSLFNALHEVVNVIIHDLVSLNSTFSLSLKYCFNLRQLLGYHF
jgi:hypothetical protein